MAKKSFLQRSWTTWEVSEKVEIKGGHFSRFFFFTNCLLEINGAKKYKFPNLAGSTSLKYVISGQPLIAPEPLIGNFQNWAEMKVNYPTSKEFNILGNFPIITRAREKFYIQIPQSRIDELLFQEPTTKISAPNSKYNCSFAQ